MVDGSGAESCGIDIDSVWGVATNKVELRSVQTGKDFEKRPMTNLHGGDFLLAAPDQLGFEGVLFFADDEVEGFGGVTSFGDCGVVTPPKPSTSSSAKNKTPSKPS